MLLWIEAVTVAVLVLTTSAPLPAALEPLPADGVTPMISSSCSAPTLTALALTTPLAPMPATVRLPVTWTLKAPPTAVPSSPPVASLPNSVGLKLPAIDNCSTSVLACTASGASQLKPRARSAWLALVSWPSSSSTAVRPASGVVLQSAALVLVAVR